MWDHSPSGVYPQPICRSTRGGEQPKGRRPDPNGMGHPPLSFDASRYGRLVFGLRWSHPRHPVIPGWEGVQPPVPKRERARPQRHRCAPSSCAQRPNRRRLAESSSPSFICLPSPNAASGPLGAGRHGWALGKWGKGGDAGLLFGADTHVYASSGFVANVPGVRTLR